MNDSEITLPEIREKLYVAVVCDALDVIGFPNQSPRVPLLPCTFDGVTAGRCKTTSWVDMFHEDPSPYEKELQAVDECQPDDIIIAAAGGSMRSGIWGELLTTAALNRGCVGAIIDGAVRDLAKIRMLGFPVYARGACAYDSQNRQRVIDLDVTVEIGGVRFHPGDLVLADVDGIVVVPRQVEAEVIRRAWRKVVDENRTRDAIRQGMKASEAYRSFGVL